jgi:hypothetical protein
LAIYNQQKKKEKRNATLQGLSQNQLFFFFFFTGETSPKSEITNKNLNNEVILEGFHYKNKRGGVQN